MNNEIGHASKNSESDPLEATAVKNYSTKRLLRFAFPSLVGVLLFLTPFIIDGKFTVIIAYLISSLNAYFKAYMLPISLMLTITSAVLSVIVPMTPLLEKSKNRFIQLFNPGAIWILIRVLGAISIIMIYLNIGPEWIWDRKTGGVMLLDVAPVLLILYFLSAIFLPLLTNYGLMEFIGTLLNKRFKRIFNLPGFAAVDALASWLSASSVGMILTIQQYRTGLYTKREAAMITTNFSVVSIAFAYVMLSFIKLEHLFIQWYISVVITGIICAIIVPKLPPLKKIPNDVFTNAPVTPRDEINIDGNPFKFALRKGIERADCAPSIWTQLKDGIHTASDVAITVFPTLMLIGVGGLALIEYTNVIQFLSIPLIPLLNLLQLPEASLAATAMLSGVIEILMPSILGAHIESELTRFVVAGVAINEIIFLSEVAIILIRANIGLNLLNLLAIWCLRLLIALPILTLLGNIFVP